MRNFREMGFSNWGYVVDISQIKKETMNKIIKDSIIFFIALLAFGLFMEYLYCQSKNIEFQFSNSKIGVYAVFAILYGFWRNRKRT